VTLAYDKGPLSAWLNGAWSQALGKDIVSSEFNFDPADLAYIATHFVHLDHDQTISASAGASYALGRLKFSGDAIFGTGLRRDLVLPGGDTIPNGAHLPAYAQLNLSASYRIALAGGPVDLKLDVINVTDARYEIRDGTGVGVGAPQWGPRRGVFAGITKAF
jgi:outer membrane receptor for ferrienterochelin and colicins